MRCPRCGREATEGAAFCGGCGADLRESHAQQRADRDLEQPAPPEPPRTSGLAIASLILGILGLICFPVVFSVIGLILGIMALSAIARSGNRLQGQGMAVAGTILSGIGVLLIPVIAAILFPVFSQAREKARTATCMSNVKQLGLGMLMYVQDYDEKFPPADRWADNLVPYTKEPKVFVCPSAPAGNPRTYAYNGRLHGVALSVIVAPRCAAMVFDARTQGANPRGGPDIVDRRHQARSSYVMGYVDGHVQTRSSPILTGPDLIWDPTAAPPAGPGEAYSPD